MFKPRVLIVEDDQTTQLMLKGLVSRTGMDVVCVSSIEEAIGALDGGYFAYALLDLNLGKSTARDTRKVWGEKAQSLMTIELTADETVERNTAPNIRDTFYKRHIVSNPVFALLLEELSAGATRLYRAYSFAIDELDQILGEGKQHVAAGGT